MHPCSTRKDTPDRRSQIDSAEQYAALLYECDKLAYVHYLVTASVHPEILEHERVLRVHVADLDGSPVVTRHVEHASNVASRELVDGLEHVRLAVHDVQKPLRDPGMVESRALFGFAAEDYLVWHDSQFVHGDLHESLLQLEYAGVHRYVVFLLFRSLAVQTGHVADVRGELLFHAAIT